MMVNVVGRALGSDLDLISQGELGRRVGGVCQSDPVVPQAHERGRESRVAIVSRRCLCDSRPRIGHEER